jgi:glycosyltransferase involved in cell wall biosynthesis
VTGERRWLIVSYFSGIDGMACAQHIDDRIPLFLANGVTPVLLTGICGPGRSDVVQARIPSMAPSGIRFEARHVFRRMGLRGAGYKVLEAILLLPLLPFYLLEKLLIDLDSQWSWFPLAAVRGYFLARRYRPEVIYSTGGPASAHVAAGLIARWTGIPWIAELQDPLVHDDWQRGRRALRVMRRVERFVCRNASRVVFLTEGARERAAARTGFGEKGTTVYPGADARIFPETVREKGPFCRFAHFGSFGRSRNPEVFLEALRRLFLERPGTEQVIRLALYGTCDRRSQQRIEAFPWPEVVQYHGRVTRKESLSSMRRADVLLLVQNTDDFSAETIPSKTYEYFHAGRPVLGLVYRNPELAGMLRSLGHRVADAADAAAVKKAVTALYEDWKNGTVADPLPSPYTAEGAVKGILAAGRETR